jgi:hypothetical protein
MEVINRRPVGSSRRRLTSAPSDEARKAFNTSQRDETQVIPAREVDG